MASKLNIQPISQSETNRWINGQTYRISINLNGWYLHSDFDKSELIKIRDRINELLGVSNISEIFSVSIEEAEKIENFQLKNKSLCGKCELKFKECKNCVLVCQSPLERDLFLGLRKMALNIELQKRIKVDGSTYDYPETVVKNNILTVPDFYIENDLNKICIYADGHTYHERTEDQALRDRKIDRTLQELGFMCLRYTGKEIRTELDKVIEDIMQNLKSNKK